MAVKTADPKPGTKFYMLTVINHEVTVIGRVRYFDVQCDCGTIKKVSKAALVHNTIKSCGCAKGLMISNRLRTHGASKSKLYHTWKSMISRCQDTTNKSYPRYGGRGIAVCKSWFTFSNFELDMGFPSTENLSIGRIDNDKGYYKENCKWDTSEEQNNNTSRSVLFDFRGQKLPLKTISKIANFNLNTLKTRVYRHGMNAEDAVNTPVMTSSEVPSHSRNPAFNTTNQRIRGEKIYSSSCVGLVKVNKE